KILFATTLARTIAASSATAPSWSQETYVPSTLSTTRSSLSEPSTNSDPAAIRIANISAVPKDIRIRNNIFITQSNANRVRLVNSVQDSTYVFQRNNYFNAAGAVRITWGATTYLSATIADWLASTTQERLGGTIVALSED